MSVSTNSLFSAVNTSNNSAWITYNSDEELAAVELFADYSTALLRFATACCIFFMVIGIPGNIITIVALARYKKVHNATAMFIMNLSCADLLFICFNLPQVATTFYYKAWVHGRTMCRLFPLARYALVAVSLLTILAITINRYVMMAHPRLYPKMYKTRFRVLLMIAAIWISATSILLPTWFEKWGRFGLDTDIGSCSILPDKKNRSPKRFLFLGAFILPCLVIVVCYARIFCIVRKSTKKSLKTKKVTKVRNEKTSDSDTSSLTSHPVTSTHGNDNVTSTCDNFLEVPPKNKDNGSVRFKTSSNENDDELSVRIDERDKKQLGLRRTALRKSMALLKLSLPTRKDRRLGTMILAIMISFCVCHLPITITKMLREIHPLPGVNVASLILLYLSSSINPVIYVVMSNDYRKAYKNLFGFRRRTTISHRISKC